jgi:hypothetical protein
MRFHYWRHGEAMTELAKSLYAEPEIDWVADLEGEIIAASPGAFRFDLSNEDAKKYRHLLDRAGLGSISRSEHGVYISMSQANRFNRNFGGGFVFDVEPRSEPPDCNQQYLSSEMGRCRIRLDDHWSIHYYWHVPL